MQWMKRILSDRRFQTMAVVGLLGMVGCGFVAWRAGVDLATLLAWWEAAQDFLGRHPVWLFLAIVVLPGFPVPASALMILAGTVWKERPLMACAICLTGMALNMSWTYWVAAKPARGLVERFLARGTIRLPELPKGERMQIILLMRLTPGIPLFFQNYLLGFLRVPFLAYLVVSLGCTGMIAVGVVLSSAGVADGNLKPLITGVALIVVGVVVVQMLRQRLKR
jgi:uncharacterized membrane protein YdjX (TVP38/TMEM64 family)